LSASVLAELWVIWKTDKRVPSCASRAAWARSRGVNVKNVHNWFTRRKVTALKAGETISDASYELGLE
ncbi:hypothetical protein BJ138DRAFT_986256, partial [Hygrophoropsis aurantiaca]